jgi:hypothetical protein
MKISDLITLLEAYPSDYTVQLHDYDGSIMIYDTLGRHVDSIGVSDY